ncbi:casein kinase 1-like protein HD16 isoform X3 [Camellia sinensis]|uniref:casein kinase 1-like protein HD16 isoform X3 n=1 Tax=Camellia sinensis TaxID=4442 RepID=UPI0010360553|nr:casein kinase 1-like protein HD16 isoform X3 [Camellia sinensis]
MCLCRAIVCLIYLICPVCLICFCSHLLCQHVEKGNEDGLYISCVASAANLWAVIMNAGTSFCSQVYELSAVFLHKDWIMEQWEKNYYISSIVGAVNGSSLVVMSKDISHVGVYFLWNACLWRMWLTFVFIIYEE